jgi:hypothetical protein
MELFAFSVNATKLKLTGLWSFGAIVYKRLEPF